MHSSRQKEATTASEKRASRASIRKRVWTAVNAGTISKEEAIARGAGTTVLANPEGEAQVVPVTVVLAG